MAAPIDRVWAVLTDFDAYADSHPYITSAHGDLVLGGQIMLTAPGAGGLSLDIKIVDVEAPRLLVFEGGDPDHILVRHSWRLTPLPGGTTRVDDHESFLGPEAAAMFNEHSETMRQQLKPIMDALTSAVESRDQDSRDG